MNRQNNQVSDDEREYDKQEYLLLYNNERLSNS